MSDPNLSRMNDRRPDSDEPQQPAPRVPRRTRSMKASSYPSAQVTTLYNTDEATPNAPPLLYPTRITDEPAFGANFQTPVGYDVKDLLTENNVVFLIPCTSVEGQPMCVKLKMKVAGEKIVLGGGSYTEESKFIVSVPRPHDTETIITLESVKYRGKFVCIDRKAKIKTMPEYKDCCDFFVYQVGDSSRFCFESAQSDSLYLGIRSNNTPSDTSSITNVSEEAHFIILTDELSPSYPTPKLLIFDNYSIMNDARNRCVIRLFSQRRYLAIDDKGKIVQTHYREDKEGWFIIYDRGMGMVSMQSYKYLGYWLRTNVSLNKGELGSDAIFRVKESVDHLVCFESMLHPGLYLLPPLHNTATEPSPIFSLEIVQQPETVGICTS